jgi:hypothetical protein
MNHDEIQLLAARCLTEPAFLAKALELAHTAPARRMTKRRATWAREAATVATVFGREQLKRMALFGGFITKVRHRALRKYLPGTLRLIEQLGIELGFFARFFPHYSKARACGPLTTGSHLALLEKHLTAYAKRLPTPERRLMGDVLIHEMTCWEAFQDGDKTPARGSEDGVAWRGRFLVRRYATHAAAASQALRDLPFSREKSYLVENGLLLAYWRADEDPGLAVFEVDELTALIFSEVNGQRSIPAIAAVLACKGLPEITIEQLRGFFKDAATQGFVSLPRCGGVKPAAGRSP